MTTFLPISDLARPAYTHLADLALTQGFLYFEVELYDKTDSDQFIRTGLARAQERFAAKTKAEYVFQRSLSHSITPYGNCRRLSFVVEVGYLRRLDIPVKMPRVTHLELERQP